MRKVDVKLDLTIDLKTSEVQSFSVQSAFDVPPQIDLKIDKRFLSPITFSELRSLRAKGRKVFKNKNCSAPVPIFGFNGEILCEVPCGLCDSCLSVRKQMRSKKNGKKTN